MKDMIQKMTDIETEEKSKKQQINEAASMNISMTGDDASQVGQLMAMMRNAGMDPKPVGGDMPLPMRKDIDKFRGIVGAHDDDPNIPGKDDVPGDQDLKAGLIGAALGALGGGALGSATGATGALAAKGAALGTKAGAALGAQTAGAGLTGAKGLAAKVAGGAKGAMTGGKIGKAIGGAIPSVAGAAVGDKLTDKEAVEGGDYANSPDEEYAPYSDMVKGGDDINRPKKTYPKVAGGDNPMALAGRIKEELDALYKEYKK